MKLEPGAIKFFQEQHIPKDASLAGLSALVQFLNVQAPVRLPSAVSQRHVKGTTRQEGNWHIFDVRYLPEPTIGAHLTFALKHENVDLLVLKRIFEAIPAQAMAEFVSQTPAGTATRRAWFLYEFLTGKELDIVDAPKVSAIDVLDPKSYFTSEGTFSRRHRVRNNLLGVPNFCPVIRRTPALSAFMNQNLQAKASETIGRVSGHLIARAASFMLLADSQASFQIEGEHPPRSRLERWGRAVLQSGRMALTLEEIVRLQGILIADNRFVKIGLRDEGVFLGEWDADGNPLPEFIGAKSADLQMLMSALIETNNIMNTANIDPVVQAAAVAFGFVYIHPFTDGNGRMHRCLIHHVLAERRFAPSSMVFPVSSVMLDRIDDYRKTLQEHSAALMPYIEWYPTATRNVDVVNDTADLYRYFDATSAAEFLYSCVAKTVTHDLPYEIEYLKRRDEAIKRLMNTVEMPDKLAEDFLLFVRRNDGVLPKRRRKDEFARLTDKEVSDLETIVRDVFADFEDVVS